MRIALGIEYDGSGFCGWQDQQQGRTVQSCVEAALLLILGKPLLFTQSKITATLPA